MPSEEPGPRTPLAGRRPRVLVVDDDDDIHSAHRHARPRRADVVTAITAVARLFDDRPDAVVLDLGLPDIDGFEVLRRVRHDRHSVVCSLPRPRA
jgi:DNA-binding response OmpR family regulator